MASCLFLIAIIIELCITAAHGLELAMPIHTASKFYWLLNSREYIDEAFIYMYYPQHLSFYKQNIHNQQMVQVHDTTFVPFEINSTVLHKLNGQREPFEFELIMKNLPVYYGMINPLDFNDYWLLNPLDTQIGLHSYIFIPETKRFYLVINSKRNHQNDFFQRRVILIYYELVPFQITKQHEYALEKYSDIPMPYLSKMFVYDNPNFIIDENEYGVWILNPYSSVFQYCYSLDTKQFYQFKPPYAQNGIIRIEREYIPLQITDWLFYQLQRYPDPTHPIPFIQPHSDLIGLMVI
eukprot:254842_1